MQALREPNAKAIFWRLEPGEELLDGIKAGCAKFGVTAGTITSCIGSLTKTAYTFVKSNPANVSKIAYRDTIVAEDPNELICGQGTVGLTDGKLDVHLHALMCDVNGKMFAGHMMPGSIICATMEISIAVAEAGQMKRGMDPIMQLPLFHFSAK